MLLRINPSGQVFCLYGESIDLAALGELSIQRASHVEPDDRGQWWADMAPVNGPKLGPHVWRSEALAAEQTWLEQYKLGGSSTLN